MLYSIDEFASACGMPRKSLMVYVGRKKVIVEAGKIDDSNDKNKAFLAKKKIDPTKQPPPVKEKAPPSTEVKDNSVFETVISHEGQSYTESERQLKYLDTLKRAKEIEKLDVEIAKKKGEVIPSELVKPVFLQHNQSIVTEFKNSADEIIRIISKRKDLTVNEVAEITGELIGCINTSINKATKLSIKAVENIIKDFTDKKGVGEKNG